jgi:hypothetical protein
MAYQVWWIVENRVLYIRQPLDLTLEDIRDSTRDIADHIEAAYQHNPTPLIIGVLDMREATVDRLMRSALSVAVKNVVDVIDPRVWKAKPGFIILITTSNTVKLLIYPVIKLSSQPITTVATLAEALTVVSYMYPELQTELDDFRKTDLFAGTQT